MSPATPPLPAHHSFRDPVTQVLQAHGFLDSNRAGDLQQAEEQNFDLEPGRWRWDGSAWVVFTPPAPPPSPMIPLFVAVQADAAVPTSVKGLLNALRARLT